MKMRIKAIATDLDGTIVDEKYEIASVAVEAVRRAERLGTPVITATARPVNMSKILFDATISTLLGL